MAYAHDVVIMGRRVQDAEGIFTSLVEQIRWDLEIEDKKTQCIIVS